MIDIIEKNKEKLKWKWDETTSIEVAVEKSLITEMYMIFVSYGQKAQNVPIYLILI